MENHLIIGLGGTGGHIIRAFRKRVYEEFRSNNVPNDSMREVAVSYLWVDSSEKDLNETQSWRTMGKSVALDPGDKVKINATTSSILDRIEDYPGISPWIGDKQTWDHIKGGITDEAGGQRRRLGRLLFAWNINEFKKKLGSHVSNLQRSSNNVNITFHIVTGLAGGTGSGSIIDVITQIREEFPNDKIIVYAKLPETATPPPHGWVSNTGYYKPNGYAALLELNALSVKAYCPYDVQGRKEAKTQRVKRMMTDRGVEAFNSTYVFANANVNGGFLDVANGELFEVVADFLYHKIITIHRVGNTQLQRLEQNENGDANHEEGTRSKRFISFGIGRIEYPEKEIREYVQYNFAKQAMLQFKYNNWSDLGFIEKPEDEIGLGYAADLRNDRNGKFPEWRIDEEHLTLSQKIVDDNRNPWLTYKEDWNRVSQFKKIASEKPKTDRLDELEELCTKRYKEDFRGVGVNDFFRNQKEELKGYASVICGLIEHDLFKDWENGNKSIVEVEKYLQTLIDVNENRIEKLGEKQQKKRQELKDTIEPNIAENRTKWNKRGVLTSLDKILGTHCDLLKRKYETMTEELGLDYAQSLLRKVNENLRELRDIVIVFKKYLTESLDKMDIAISARCKTEDTTTEGNGIITYKMYSPDDVKNKTKKIMRDDRVNKENALNVRKRLIEETHDENPDFIKMVNKISNTQILINMFEDVCADSATAAMEREQKKQVKVNIMERIANKYNGDDEGLGKFIEDKLKLASVLVQKNEEQINKGSSRDGLRIEYALLLPKYEDTTNFSEKFKQQFSKTVGSEVEVAENFKSNEIVILSMTGGFPLRYLADVNRLKNDYEEKLTDINEKQHKLLLHTEGDGSQFPSLYPETWDDTKKEEFSPYLILAMSMGLIKYGFQGKGYGNQKVYYIDNEKKTSLKHQTFRNVVENITEEDAEMIRTMVENKLNTGEYLSRSKRESLKSEIDGSTSEAVKKECAKNKHDWEKFVDAKDPAKEILDRDKERLTD
ncbi:MAG: hypothetical protein J6T81_00600 [Bacteroidales bacterium]|nr:hypothetical protein [Bacteroidales bacterium]